MFTQKIKNNLVRFILLGVFGFIFLVPVFVMAQAPSSEVVQQATGRGFVPCGNTGQEPCGIEHIFRGIAAILNFFIAFAGIFAVAMIIVGGIRLATSQGIPGKRSMAQQKIFNAIIGFALVMLSFTIVNTLFSGGSVWSGFKNGGLVLSCPLSYIGGKTTCE